MHVPLVAVGGQSAADEQVFEVEWAHTLILGQFPPGLVHETALLYLH
jgi:hypothetical protein